MTAAAQTAFVATAPSPALPPPVAASGAIGWLRANLFSTPYNAALTLICGLLVVWVAHWLTNFLLIDAVWSGADRQACLATPGRPEVGACWAFIRTYINFFLYGSYPVDERWRVDIFFAALALGIAWLMWLDAPRREIGGAYFFLYFPLVSFYLLAGGRMERFLIGQTAALLDAIANQATEFGANGLGRLLHLAFLPVTALASLIYSSPAPLWIDFGLTGLLCVFAARLLAGNRAALYAVGAFAVLAVTIKVFGLDTTGLPKVDTSQWGGLLITLVVAAVGIVASLPLGILLALGRRSSMPAVRILSVIFIEFVRGVPLITVLFMASVMLPLFVPESWSPDKLLRALVGVALFSAAYMAEVVRAGLQAIPRGQFEAAMAVGLSYWQSMRLVILPQALKITIPNIVNSAVGLFKDTTLVFIVGIVDLLKAVEVARVDPRWATPVTSATGYAFVAMIYLLSCYGMSRYARYVDARLARGEGR